MKSWIESANAPDCHFPIQNLPFGVFSTADTPPRCGVAIGDFVLDLAGLEATDLLVIPGGPAFHHAALNPFMELGAEVWSQTRTRLIDLLAKDADPTILDSVDLTAKLLVPLDQVTLHLPFEVAEYTDFYSGRSHAFNVGSMFRGPENALPPNWLHIPIGYNGRASTVVVSGTDIHRPLGQLKPGDLEKPIFGASRRLDIELEMGVVIGQSTDMGQPVTVAQADEMIFGYVLLNDWSARDIQAWEYQPLGPFQAKAFATSISPWVVTKEALEPYRVSTPERELALLPYLHEPKPMLYDIHLEILMQPETAAPPTRISSTNYRQMYYSAAQQVTHHAIGGCKMNIGDLLGSGTISGTEKDQFGSLLELSWGGKTPLTLKTGETRTFLEDGDIMTLTGWAQGEDHRIGFGSCTGRILPAVEEKDWRAEK